MTETAEQPVPDPAPMTLGEATASLTAEGQLFEMDQLEIRGVPTRIWKNAPDTLRARALGRPRRPGLHRL